MSKKRITETAPSPEEPTTTRKLADLRPHPHQDRLFHPLTGAEYSRFVEDIRLNGIRVPIEILPDGMMLDGHQRARAAREIGLTEVPVTIRHDLVGNSRAINLRHIEANANRRQLGQLDQVRLALREIEIERGRKPGGLTESEIGWLSQHVSVKIGSSKRTARRLLNIALSPMALQRAFSEDRIGVVPASRVFRLEVNVQAEIAAAIEAGEDPEQVVLARLPRQAPSPKTAARSVTRLVAALDAAMVELDGREEDLHRCCYDRDATLATLLKFAGFSASLAKRIKAEKAAAHRAMKKFANDVKKLQRPPRLRRRP